jgi:hypothetical protein
LIEIWLFLKSCDLKFENGMLWIIIFETHQVVVRASRNRAAKEVESLMCEA